jgi:hypothetical protein
VDEKLILELARMTDEALRTLSEAYARLSAEIEALRELQPPEVQADLARRADRLRKERDAGARVDLAIARMLERLRSKGESGE